MSGETSGDDDFEIAPFVPEIKVVKVSKSTTSTTTTSTTITTTTTTQMITTQKTFLAGLFGSNAITVACSVLFITLI